MARTALLLQLVGFAARRSAGSSYPGRPRTARRGAVTGSCADRVQAHRTRRPDAGATAPAPADASRSLAIEWLAALDARPFMPSAQQLDWVEGGDIVVGEARPRRMRVAATRFAGLFAEHVAQDMTVAGGPGAYALVWQCARGAFLESLAEPVRPVEGSRRSVAA